MCGSRFDGMELEGLVVSGERVGGRRKGRLMLLSRDEMASVD